jgi:pimeloyl-ACP methyl ester carboxylesterase
MLTILIVLLACILILVGVLAVLSPGKPKPFLDENGKLLADSISEKTFDNINGVKQGMFIKSKNKNNPVLLFVHGGPGMPEYFLTDSYPTGLEDYFTVCWWDQRGAGLSYGSDIKADTMTTEQIVSDTNEVSKYLCKRFSQDKIYLMGHSWGSYIAIQAAAKAPELYHAYIGMGQMSRQVESEKLAYKYMIEQYKTAGNKKMVQKLDAYPILESDTALNSYLSSYLRDEAMHDLGIGTIRKIRNMKSIFTSIVVSSLINQEYTLTEKINLWKGKIFSGSHTALRDEEYSTDMNLKVPKLDIPVYFFSGKYDYTVNYSLSEEYLKELKAPLKGFYLFRESAHSPAFEEPEKTLRIMREDVLAGKNSLADTK